MAARRKSTLWGFIAEERSRMKKREFLNRKQVLEACDRALDTLVSDEDLR
ncbi:MAG: hypothetical protein HY558_04280 [Euryarchaeota archaeon]|nr:hypothetical protein [Euryarchaeota archaeon]